VSYAWVSLAVRTRLLAAFEVAYDRAGEDRCVVLSFAHREWNDLIDRCGLSLAQLSRRRRGAAPPPAEAHLLEHLKAALDDLLPRERFANYYELYDRSREVAARTPDPATARRDTADKAVWAALMSAHAMVDDLPQPLKDVARPLALFYQSLDDLADLDADRRKGRLTYVALADDPVAEVRRLFDDCERCLRSAAPRPERLLGLLRWLMALVLDARRRGIDFESRYFDT
jgi:hypothetical protein